MWRQWRHEAAPCRSAGQRPRRCETLVRYIDRFLMFYVTHADKLQRTSVWLDNLEGGVDYLRAVVCDDSLGIAAPEEDRAVYALSNRDPIGEANVLSRGILGDIGGRLVVASPLYKHHFDLATGACLEDDAVRIPAYAARLEGDRVLIGRP
jgi:nitrite reductase (NADH) small subunit